MAHDWRRTAIRSLGLLAAVCVICSMVLGASAMLLMWIATAVRPYLIDDLDGE